MTEAEFPLGLVVAVAIAAVAVAAFLVAMTWSRKRRRTIRGFKCSFYHEDQEGLTQRDRPLGSRTSLGRVFFEPKMSSTFRVASGGSGSNFETGDKDFDAAFRVKANDSRWIALLLGPDMREGLLDLYRKYRVCRVTMDRERLECAVTNEPVSEFEMLKALVDIAVLVRRKADEMAAGVRGDDG